MGDFSTGHNLLYVNNLLINSAGAICTHPSLPGPTVTRTGLVFPSPSRFVCGESLLPARDRCRWGCGRGRRGRDRARKGLGFVNHNRGFVHSFPDQCATLCNNRWLKDRTTATLEVDWGSFEECPSKADAPRSCPKVFFGGRRRAKSLFRNILQDRPFRLKDLAGIFS